MTHGTNAHDAILAMFAADDADYQAYCEAKREIEEEPLSYEQWLEIEETVTDADLDASMCNMNPSKLN